MGNEALHPEREGLLLEQEKVVAPRVPEIPQPAEAYAAELKRGPRGPNRTRKRTDPVAKLEIASTGPGPDLDLDSARPEGLQPLVDPEAAAGLGIGAHRETENAHRSSKAPCGAPFGAIGVLRAVLEPDPLPRAGGSAVGGGVGSPVEGMR